MDIYWGDQKLDLLDCAFFAALFSMNPRRFHDIDVPEAPYKVVRTFEKFKYYDCYCNHVKDDCSCVEGKEGRDENGWPRARGRIFEPAF